MALIVHFTPIGMTEAKYTSIIRQLEAAGAGTPRGRLHHACYGPKNALKVVDIYDTPESFEAFGKLLGPILQTVGVDMGAPEVTEVCNLIRG